MHCDKKRRACGFEPLTDEGWRGCYFNKAKNALLVIYVDDFKLACPKDQIEGIWKSIRQELKLGYPEPPDRFLGSYTRPFAAKAGDMEFLLRHRPDLRKRGAEESIPAKTGIKGYDPNRPIKGFIYDMESYLEKNIENYLQKARASKNRLRAAGTPFLDEGKFPIGCQAPEKEDLGSIIRDQEREAANHIRKR